MQYIIEGVLVSIMLLVAGSLLVLNEHKKFMVPFDAALAEYEKNLPRTQSCVLVYKAEIKQ